MRANLNGRFAAAGQAASDFANRVGEDAADMIDDVGSAAQSKASDAADSVRDAASRVGNAGVEAAQSAAQFAARKRRDAHRMGGELYAQAANQAERASSTLEDVVARSPVMALVTALGVGVVLGMMASRR